MHACNPRTAGSQLRVRVCTQLTVLFRPLSRPIFILEFIELGVFQNDIIHANEARKLSNPDWN